MSDDRRQRSEARDQDRLDAAIDRTVRQMLDVEPPAGLRGRVIERISAPVASAFRRKDLLGRKIWIALPTAALVLLFVWRPWRAMPLAPPSGILVVRTSPPAGPPEAPSRNAAQDGQRVVQRPARAGQPPPRPAPTNGATVLAASLNEPNNATTDIEPLKTIAPIQVAPIDESSIAPAAIAVRPLNTITDVQVAPLTPPDRRN